MTNKNLIAQELKKIKEKCHITNEEWAKRSGVPVSTIARFLSSSLNIPNFPAVCAMLKCLGESIDEFYDRIDAKIGVPAEALKLDAVPVGVVGDIPVDMPETKVEIQERIIVQAEEMQRLKAVEREKDMQIELLEARLDIVERTMEAIKSLCSAH
jgi:transcriptional regulator with XRE-family HTH domain